MYYIYIYNLQLFFSTDLEIPQETQWPALGLCGSQRAQWLRGSHRNDTNHRALQMVQADSGNEHKNYPESQVPYF